MTLNGEKISNFYIDNQDCIDNQESKERYFFVLYRMDFGKEKLLSHLAQLGNETDAVIKAKEIIKIVR